MENLDFGIQTIPELNIIDGLFHGFLFSLPFSAPLLICISRFLIQGIVPGIFSVLGTVLGQLCFLLFISGNCRPLISFWYSFEPFLALCGAGLAFSFATNFWSDGSLAFGQTESFVPEKNGINWASESRPKDLAGRSPTIQAELEFSAQSSKRGMTNFRSILGSFAFLSSKMASFNFFTSSQKTVLLTNFVFHFILMFLNPAMPATSSRILFAAPQLIGSSYFSYSLGFLGMATFALGILWPLVFSFIIQIIQKGAQIFGSQDDFVPTINQSKPNLAGLANVKNSASSNSFFERNQSDVQNSPNWILNIWTRFSRLDNFGWAPSSKSTRFLSFLIVGCIMSGTLQYSWRLFTQYPFEFLTFGPNSAQTILSSARNSEQNSEIGLQSISRGETGQMVSSDVFGSKGENLSSSFGSSSPFSAREFPSFDSNIRHRDKNLPVDRFLPIEKMNARRTLSDRPPFTEEQKSDAYLKFHSFFINSLEKYFDNQIIRSRLPEKQKRNFAQIEYIQQLKNQLNAPREARPFLEKGERSLRESSLLSKESLLARPVENNTKGKRPQGFSYIRTLVSSENSENFVHDELQIYRTLFEKNNALRSVSPFATFTSN